MKTTYKSIIAISFALCALSCSKADESNEVVPTDVNDGGKLVDMVFGLAEDSDSRTVLAEDGKSVNFVANDEISVLDGEGNQKFITSKNGASVKFIGKAVETDTYYAVYPYSEGVALDGESISGFGIPATQTAVKGSYDPKANVSVAYCKEVEGGRQFSFLNVAALAKIEIPVAVTCEYITIESINDEVIAGGTIVATVSEESGISYEIPAEGSPKITLNGPVSGGVYYVALYPGTLEGGFIVRGFDSKGGIVTFKHTHKSQTFNRAKIKNFGKLNPDIPVPEPLSGKFTINENGDQIQFSRGNLQYQASTGNWQFAEEQYIALGTGGGNEADTTARKTQDAWIDLYCYACTGDEEVAIKGECKRYMPYEAFYESTSGTKEYWGWKHQDLSVADHTDWGYMVSGTDEEQRNPWFTLSQAEWRYLLGSEPNTEYTHNQNYGRTKKVGDTYAVCKNACLYIRVDVGDGKKVSGLLILPDEWQWPEAAGREPVEYYNCNYGVRLKSDGMLDEKGVATKYYYPVAPNGTDDSSAYTIEEFRALEAAGAVFLPVTGFRAIKTVGDDYATTVKESDKIGCYWSRTADNPGNYGVALGMMVEGDHTIAEGKTMESTRPPRCNHHYRAAETSNYRQQGYAVRLVKRSVN